MTITLAIREKGRKNMSDFISKSLASAKEALDSANKSKVSTTSGHPFEAPPVHPQFSGHSYTAAKSGGSKPLSTGEDAAQGIASKKKNVEEYQKAYPD